MKDLISIIINVYNGEDYIKRCVDSAVNQTYKNLEILIINDGSTDNTLKICESYKDKRIKIITQNNIGLSMSRNVGIENATGEYLYFIDADDFVENDVIEYLYGLTKKYDAMMYTCDTKEIYNYEYEIEHREEKIEEVECKEVLKRILLGTDRSGTTWNKLYKKELFDGIRFENRIINDVVVTYKLVLAAKKVIYSNQQKYLYVRHENSITGMDKEDRTMDFYLANRERYDYIKNIYPDLIENEACLCLAIANVYIRNGKNIADFLEKEGAFKLYKKIFKFKILKCNIPRNEKIKLILCRINRKAYYWMMRKYLKNKKIKYSIK